MYRISTAVALSTFAVILPACAHHADPPPTGLAALKDADVHVFEKVAVIDEAYRIRRDSLGSALVVIDSSSLRRNGALLPEEIAQLGVVIAARGLLGVPTATGDCAAAGARPCVAVKLTGYTVNGEWTTVKLLWTVVDTSCHPDTETTYHARRVHGVTNGKTSLSVEFECER